jgi:DNA repair exonuclease SbcCD nuclease subunit
MMRFLHLADVHLDTPFAGRAARVRSRLREAVRDAFRQAVDLAIAEEVDAVVIAGDLFDGTTFSFETERFLVTQFQRLAENRITVVYATGNHDPGSDPGRRGSILWPEGVHVSDGADPVRVQVHDRGGRLAGWITAVGHATPRESTDLSRHFPQPDGLLPEVAVLHAQVQSSTGAEEHDRYAPTTVEALTSKPYDYWALGHVHRRQEVRGDPAIYYPGNLQGRTPAESGPRGGLLVELAAGRTPQVVFRPFAPIRWETMEVSGLEAVETLDALIRAVRRRWDGRLDDEADRRGAWMVRVRLKGGTPLWRLLRDPSERETLEAELTGELDVLDATVDAEGVHAPVDPNEHIARDDALGWVLRRLEALRAGEALPESLAQGLQGWREGEEALEEYLMGILDGADADLVVRMTKPKS